MSDTSRLGFPDAARSLGVPVRVLRSAIRAGKIPAPPQAGATAVLPAAWLDSVRAAVAAQPKALARSLPQKVPAFARYEGTSAWRKYTKRVHEFYRFKAAAN